ncbi:MAG: hypothetical protein GTN62_15125, partial [Gemmatimonadales bacterium]|nr:hypothetical protein [Gemmatimonadales bacterium]NIP08885.1 hypothetical protein [Gemmatimonadales bacterium]NIS63755.1 hypothetical protein [Gemmatimonadales bacterium]
MTSKRRDMCGDSLAGHVWRVLGLIGALTLATPEPAVAYVGPGAGFV